MIWYFAYGANMSNAVMVRRGIHPLRSVPAILADHRLAFNLRGMPLVEPVFANVVSARDDVVHGVAHQLTTPQFRRLWFQEGVGLAYRTATVEVQSYAGVPLMARTFIARCTARDGRPSRRYLQLLIDGAEQHGLDAAHRLRLQAQPASSTLALPRQLSDWSDRLMGSLSDLFKR